MSLMKRLFVWLSRIGKCRGFGIQSPSDYRFVRYVINEHWPYYQYAELGHGDDWLTRKLGKLYFRLCNDRQPSSVLSIGGNHPYDAYIQSGCNKTRLVHMALNEINDDAMRRLFKENSPAIIRMDTDCLVLGQQYMVSILKEVPNQSFLVLEHIHQDRQTIRQWRELLAKCSRNVISFDLYYCGIIIFDDARTTQHYVINF